MSKRNQWTSLFGRGLKIIYHSWHPKRIHGPTPLQWCPYWTNVSCLRLKRYGFAQQYLKPILCLQFKHTTQPLHDLPDVKWLVQTTARLKSIQIKFHPIELTLGRENVHIRLTPGVLREHYFRIVYRDLCFVLIWAVGGTYSIIPPPWVLLNYSLLSYTHVQIIFQRTTLSLEI